MKMATGTVTAAVANGAITVSGLAFRPDVIIVRLISPVPSGTDKSMLLWIYTPYGGVGIRTDSTGIDGGLQGAATYTDHGISKIANGTSGMGISVLSDSSFCFQSVHNTNGPILVGSEFEWTAIKYME